MSENLAELAQTGFTIVHRTFARVGLFGNPSDQYGGRTIAFSLENFYAEVILTPTPSLPSTIRFQPHPVYDSLEYGSLSELVTRTTTEGLYGGVRLLVATCKRFAEYCAQRGVPLRHRSTAQPVGGFGAESGGGGGDGRDGSGGGFTLSYDTNIPRQTGLAGSSAIIYSAIKCLMQWYGIGDDELPPSERPGLVLSIESGELGIAAGLQDRVIQVYGGVLHMDFDPAYMAAHGGVGRYSRLNPGLLPQPLYVMYSQNPSESGKVHSGVKAKWLEGDPRVRSLMAQVAECGDAGLRLLLMKGSPTAVAADGGAAVSPAIAGAAAAGAIAAGGGADCGDVAGTAANADPSPDQQLAQLMNFNFDLRRALFGDDILGARNIRMVELARSVGAGANFTGSGGAVVVFCPAGEQQAAELGAAAVAEGFTLMQARIGPVQADLPPAAIATPPS